MIDLWSIRSLALASVILYLGFDYLDGRRVNDEREKLIQLKSLELAHQVTLATLLITATAYIFFPWLNTLTVIVILILAALYTEILGKIFYRLKM